MSGLIKREMQFDLIPPMLEKEFKKEVLDAYEMGWYDLHHIAFVTEDYCVYAHSYEETGDPYQLSDDPTKSDMDFADIKEASFNELISDVYEVLRFYHMFHGWNDLDPADLTYSGLVYLSNPPVKAVW